MIVVLGKIQSWYTGKSECIKSVVTVLVAAKSNLPCYSSKIVHNLRSKVALGKHCIYLKPRDHESANHV